MFIFLGELYLISIFFIGCGQKEPVWYRKNIDTDSFCGNGHAKEMLQAKSNSIDDMLKNIALKVDSRTVAYSSSEQGSNKNSFTKRFHTRNLVENISGYLVVEYEIDKGLFSDEHYMRTCIAKTKVVNSVRNQVAILEKEIFKNQNIIKGASARTRLEMMDKIDIVLEKQQLLSLIDNKNIPEENTTAILSLRADLARARVVKIKASKSAKEIVNSLLTAHSLKTTSSDYFDYTLESFVSFEDRIYTPLNTYLSKSTITINIKNNYDRAVQKSFVFMAVGEAKSQKSARFNALKKLKEKIIKDMRVSESLKSL